MTGESNTADRPAEGDVEVSEPADPVVVVVSAPNRAGAVIRWASHPATNDKTRLDVLYCTGYARAAPFNRDPDQAADMLATEVAEAVNELRRTGLEITVTEVTEPDPITSQAYQAARDRAGLLIVGADGGLPLRRDQLPLDERVVRTARVEVTAIDPGTTDGRDVREILVPMGDELAEAALVNALSLANANETTTIRPVLVGSAFGEDAVAVTRRELIQTLRRSGVKRTPKIEPTVALADLPMEGILAASEASDLVLVGSVTTRALRLFRALEKERHAGEDGNGHRPAVAIVRPARSRKPRVKMPLIDSLFARVPKLDSTARLALFDRLSKGARWDWTFSVMIGLSTAIASLGLMQGSTAVVIGAMLVAPLMSPLIAMGLALVQGNFRLFAMAFKAMSLGVLAGFALSVTIGVVIFTDALTAEILQRGAPTILDLIVALLSGMAAAFVLSQPSLKDALAGVAIAAALIPPLASSGIAATHLNLAVALGAFMLLTTNLVAIVLGAALVFRALGVQGSRVGISLPLWVRRAFLTLVLAAVLLSIPLVLLWSEELKLGQDRPFFQTVSVRLENAIFDRVVEEPDVDLYYVSRPAVRDTSEVHILLSAEYAPSPQLLRELEEIVWRIRGKETPVRIHVLWKARPPPRTNPDVAPDADLLAPTPTPDATAE